MKNTLRTELRKALTSKMLAVAIVIGTIFCAMDVVENYGLMREFDQRLRDTLKISAKLNTGHTGYSLFYLWMGINPNTRGANLFASVWPVLAALAYGWSYIGERRNGVYNQIVSRTGVRTYYVAKYITVFVSGGLAVGVPMLLNLFTNALVCPYDIIPPSFNVLNNGNFLSELFYTHPWAYGLIWCGMAFLSGGVAACLCFVVGTMLRHGVMAILTPYAIYVALDVLVTSLRQTVWTEMDYHLSPLQLLKGSPGYSNPEWLVFSILGVLTLSSFGVGYWQVVKHELA